MTLLESLTAIAVFSTAAAASVQIVSLASAASTRHGRTMDLLDRQDAQIQLIDRQIRRQKQLIPSRQDCSIAATQMQSVAESIPVPEDVSRRVARIGHGDQLLIEVGVDGLPLPRQRLYRPATLNLCGGVAPSSGTPHRKPEGERND